MIYFILLFNLNSSYGIPSDHCEKYIDEWKKFYPSRALARGMNGAIFDYEDLAANKIDRWLSYNQSLLLVLSDSSLMQATQDRIDLRLLKMQVLKEIDKWDRQASHQTALSLYTTLISNAVTPVLEADFLTSYEKAQLICKRLESVDRLSKAAMENLTGGMLTEVERGLKRLAEAENFYKEKLPGLIAEWGLVIPCYDFSNLCKSTAEKIGSLIAHVNTTIVPKAKASKLTLGRDEYVTQLSLYFDNPLTPEKLAEMALEEIELVRGIMGKISQSYFMKEYPGRAVPKDYDSLVSIALADMEKDAPKSGEEYLKFWQSLSQKAEQFVNEKKIATLPQNKTLRILTAPESAGPAARIGWVNSAPPFAPNPVTTLYVPSIPDSLPQKEKDEFWASFNKPFNRIIVIHELFPGHYMQNKVARESPHPVRLLFPFGAYSEGWATFCESVALNAGWEEDNHLTWLAHLRKRLENANRAYTSVQVHCNGWDKDTMINFSTKTSLLAPQFAKSLWGRLMNSPMQMTSYFFGSAQFRGLLATEQQRLGSNFDLTNFMDTILRAGPIPIDEFSNVFARPNSQL